jgi:hypothetical protein
MEHPQPLGQHRKVMVEHDEQGTGILRSTELLVLFIRSSDRPLDLVPWLCEPQDGRIVETPMGTACGKSRRRLQERGSISHANQRAAKGDVI